MHLKNLLYGVIFNSIKNGNTYLQWIIKVMNVMGVFVSFQFHERELYQM